MINRKYINDIQNGKYYVRGKVLVTFTDDIDISTYNIGDSDPALGKEITNIFLEEWTCTANYLTHFSSIKEGLCDIKMPEAGQIPYFYM